MKKFRLRQFLESVDPCSSCLLSAKTLEEYDDAKRGKATWLGYEDNENNGTPYCDMCAQGMIGFAHGKNAVVVVNGKQIENPLTCSTKLSRT